jgi:hypothetical protein
MASKLCLFSHSARLGASGKKAPFGMSEASRLKLTMLSGLIHPFRDFFPFLSLSFARHFTGIPGSGVCFAVLLSYGCAQASKHGHPVTAWLPGQPKPSARKQPHLIIIGGRPCRCLTLAVYF